MSWVLEICLLAISMLTDRKTVQKKDLVHNAFSPQKSADGKGLNCIYTARIILFSLKSQVEF